MSEAAIIAIMFIGPWAATFLGSLAAVKMPLARYQKHQGALLGFAAGVMMASTVWSLLIPAFDYSGFAPVYQVAIVSLGFTLGCAGMLLLDKLLPHQHAGEHKPEGLKSQFPRETLLVLAVALHNIPEGLALGVILSAVLTPGIMTWPMAISFALGLGLQNFPEGMAVVLPLKQTGMADKKILLWGILASFAEPLAAALGIAGAYFLTSAGSAVMPVLLGCAAGAMTFIIVEELIPESQQSNRQHSATYGFLFGFWIMVVMGVLGG